MHLPRGDGLTGWSLATDNFGQMDQPGDAPEEKSQESSSEAVEVPEPELPVLNEDVCPARTVPSPIGKSRGKLRCTTPGGGSLSQIGLTMWVGQEMTTIGSMYVVYEPDRVLVTKTIADLSLKTTCSFAMSNTPKNRRPPYGQQRVLPPID